MSSHASSQLPEWARTHNLGISFNYAGPLELGKQLMGYRWELHGYSLEWLHRRATAYDSNLASSMAAEGSTAACLVWSTGFSVQNEQYHWDIVRRRIREYHRRGMHCIVYISLTNCFWQEMFRSVPECEGWRQQGPDGEPRPYEGISYGGKPVTRYLMCVHNPHWRAYQKLRIKAALEAGADGIFWDNNFAKCHCPICREKFHEFTRERLGEPHDIPSPLAGEPPSKQDLASAREVVFDWIPVSHPLYRVHLAKNLFRYMSIADILQELKEYTLGIKPDAVWCNNGHLCQDIYRTANVMLSEDLGRPGYDAAAKRLRTNSGVLRYLYEEEGRSTPAIVNGSHPEVFAYGCASYCLRDRVFNTFLAANSALFRNPRSVARVALIATEMNYIHHRSNWFDNLTKRHILYDVIPLHRMEKHALDAYDVVLLRSVLFLSDARCRRLRDYVSGGGTLIATNDTSLYDENWARRPDYGLADVFGVSKSKARKPRRIEHAAGKGKSIFYPGAAEIEIETEPDGRAAEDLARDVLAGVKDPVVRVEAPAGVAVNVMRAAHGLVVHVLNYREEPVEHVTVTLTPETANRGTIKRIAALGAGSVKASRVVKKKGLSFTLPKVDRYTAVVVG